jgi:hypothetical protein
MGIGMGGEKPAYVAMDARGAVREEEGEGVMVGGEVDEVQIVPRQVGTEGEAPRRQRARLRRRTAPPPDPDPDPARSSRLLLLLMLQ